MNAALIDVTVTAFDDGFPGRIAHCLDFPELLGHGADNEEAVADLVEQIETRTLH